MKARCGILARSCLLIGLIAAFVTAVPAAAQYIYFDTNNDGINTWADSLNASGPTTVDVWIDTGLNDDGSPGFCGQAGFSSYEVLLQATGGTMTWGTWNPVLGSVNAFNASNTTDFHTAYHNNNSGGMASNTPLGRYKIGTFSMTPASGSPCVGFGTTSALSPRFATSYGSGCLGSKHDHTPRLGRDWAHSAVVPLNPSAAPILTAPGIVVPKYLDPVVIDVQAVSTACGIISSLTADMAALPPGHNATFTIGSGNQGGTFTWQPTVADQGDFQITFTGRGKNPNAASTKTTIVHLPSSSGVEQKQGSPNYALEQNRPNPFRPATSIPYSVPKATHVRLVVYDVSGRAVARVVDRVESPGRHVAPWSGTDDRGRALSSGVYWYRLTTEFGTQTRRLVLAR
jgi:hypothetical protein